MLGDYDAAVGNLEGAFSIPSWLTRGPTLYGTPFPTTPASERSKETTTGDTSSDRPSGRFETPRAVKTTSLAHRRSEVQAPLQPPQRLPEKPRWGLHGAMKAITI